MPAMSLMASVAMSEPTCMQRAPSTPTMAHVGTSPVLPCGYRSDRRTAGKPSGGADQKTVTCASKACTVPHTSGRPSSSHAAATASRVSKVSLPSITRSAPASRPAALSTVRRTSSGHDAGLGGEVGGDAGGARRLGRPDVGEAVHHLPLKIGCLDRVVVDHGQRAHPGGGEGQHDGGTEAAGADDRDVRGGEAPLPDLAEGGKARVTRGARAFGRAQRRNRFDERWQRHAPRLAARRRGAGGDDDPGTRSRGAFRDLRPHLR